MGKLIVISSGKGGVGKTTTSVNLASALAKQERNVVLVDANLTTPNVGLHLGLTKFPVTLNDVLKGEANLTDSLYIHPLGFKLLPGSLSVRSFAEINSRKLKKVFDDLKEMSDYVIVDSAAGLGSEALSVIKLADELIIVTNPELPAVTDAFKVVTVAKEIGIPVKGVVLNRVRRNNYDLGLRAIESLLETPITSVIEDDKNMRQAVYRKKPIIHIRPNSHTAQQYHLLADRVHKGEYERRIEELEAENSFLRSVLRGLGFN
ncbi:P-loop NTPase [Candidatus Woesearchaeota archaeon]|nr:cell division ATPase MinD [Nanoarchaeota archaeon]MCB9370838.1 P-loop NTPase [Candidatus Woesearchaeota archaeon]USN43938.1 MAG: P-loop NTPase [Candidatus Woesearchaeota archaeon]